MEYALGYRECHWFFLGEFFLCTKTAFFVSPLFGLAFIQFRKIMSKFCQVVQKREKEEGRTLFGFDGVR